MKRMNAGRFAGFALLSGFGVIGEVQRADAYSGTCNMNFNNYSALAALPGKAGYTFASSPFYSQPCDFDKFSLEEDASGGIHGHYHLAYENTCIMTAACDSDSWAFPASTKAGCARATCLAIDAAVFYRYVSSHDVDQVLRATLHPTPPGGQYCIPNGGGGQSCTSVYGKFFSPRSIDVRPETGSVKVSSSYLTTMAVGTPSGTRYTLVRYTFQQAFGPGNNQVLQASTDAGLWDRILISSNDGLNYLFDNLKIAK